MSVATLAPAQYAYRPTVAVPTCPVCDHPNKSREAKDRYGYTIGLSECDCGLIYLNPRLDAAGYAEFYRHVYRPLINAWCPPVRDPLADAQRRGERVGQMLAACGVQGGHLLDVGGGTGALAVGVASVLQPTSVTILDPNGDELRAARAKGFATIAGLIEDEDLPDSRFDAIVCVKTADHWLDPLQALRQLRGHLVDGGYLWIDIVDAREWCKNAPLDTWKIDHPLYWTRASFQRALRRTGWRIVARRWPLAANGTVNLRRVQYVCRGV